MSYTSTTNLNLRKDNGDEKIIDMRPHLNTNLDIIDQAYEELDGRCRGQQTWGNLKSTSTWGELKGNGVTTPSSQTTNLELIKPGYDSNVDVEVFNDNMDIIDSSIKSLRDSVGINSKTISINSSVGSIRSSSFKRTGKLVVLSFEFIAVSSSKTYNWEQIATVPSGYRPSTSFRTIVTCGESGTVILGSVEAGGVIKLKGTVPPNSVVAMLVTYFTP